MSTSSRCGARPFRQKRAKPYCGTSMAYWDGRTAWPACLGGYSPWPRSQEVRVLDAAAAVRVGSTETGHAVLRHGDGVLGRLHGMARVPRQRLGGVSLRPSQQEVRTQRRRRRANFAKPPATKTPRTTTTATANNLPTRCGDGSEAESVFWGGSPVCDFGAVQLVQLVRCSTNRTSQRRVLLPTPRTAERRRSGR